MTGFLILAAVWFIAMEVAYAMVITYYGQSRKQMAAIDAAGVASAVTFLFYQLH